MNEQIILDSSFTYLGNLSDDIKNLNTKTIFFGHQSVGFNIIDGIIEIQNANPQLRLNIKETAIDNLIFETPAFLHARVGTNTAPRTKIDDFVKVIDFYGDKIDIGFLKFCYADFDKETNIEMLFKDYMNATAELKVRYPKMKLIHFTVPLTTKQEGIKGKIKRIINLDTNIHRNKFNELIRKNYQEEEIFDLARFESTYPSGKIYVYGHDIQGLIPEYTSDGGHLNKKGRIIIAYKLLEKLLKTVE